MIDSPTNPNPAWAICGPAPARQRGVVMIITCLALILIASLVFYVFNIGRNVQSRVVAQNAADSAAMAGAGWVARSMNTTAMNNVEMARLIAEVNVLDATDQALHPAYHEAKTHYQALNDDLYPSAGGRGNLSQGEARFIREKMDPIIDDYQYDLKNLEPVKRLFRAPAEHEEYRSPSGPVDVRDYTMFQGSGGRGKLWRAMQALDGYSQTIMRTMPQLAQHNAALAGRVNLHRQAPEGSSAANADAGTGTGQAMIAPVVPEIPWERGEFDDFQRPVEQGLLRPETDDPHYRRGPYDTVFGWRTPRTEQEQLTPGAYVQDDPPSNGTGPGGPGGISPPDRDGSGHYDPPPRYETNTIGYNVFGPEHWLLYRFRGGSDFNLRRSPFEKDRNKFAHWKLDYLWHGRDIVQFRFPVYIIDWNDATSVADNGSAGGESRTIYRTRFFVARLESQINPDSRAFLTPGTYQTQDEGKIVTFDGDWQMPESDCAPLNGEFGNDPRNWQAVLDRMRNRCQAYNALPAASRAYWASASFENLEGSDWRKVRFTSRIQRDGQDLWQVVYYFCIGIDVGEKLPIRNPYNFDDRSDLPAPIHLVQDQLSWNDTQARRDKLTFLGIAQQPNNGTFWSEGFDDSDAYQNQVALAQAYVFNNHSWDLWTQMWHAQLEPINRYDDWLDKLDEGRGQANQIPGMTNQDLSRLDEHLQNIEPLARFMLRH